MPENGWTLFTTPRAFVRGLGIDEASEEALQSWALLYAREWRSLVGRRDGGGREYYSKKGSRVFLPKRHKKIGVRRAVSKYRASLPGDPPVQDTGELRDSIGWRPISPLHIQIFWTHPAMPILEWGSASGFEAIRRISSALIRADAGATGGGVIAPRPSIRPALAVTRPFLSSEFQGAVRSRLGRITLSGVRRRFAKLSSTLGTLQAFGIRPSFFGPIRGTSLRIARGLGDLDAIHNGTIGERLIRRGVGFQLGRFSSQMVPPGGGRIGRRIVRVGMGRFTGRILRGL